ncbi:hypothetical protein IMSHALPRED_009986 [Imshaugia aleurites]|uniref:Uncharacterized protein n=1 Tax=Imshaugia aleurites TaxID=172621 RepID=A0A8H3EYR6_9LECA|nr:hypothetical protein IMSHALPRED_009986 [Imshaugia aleurites]
MDSRDGLGAVARTGRNERRLETSISMLSTETIALQNRGDDVAVPQQVLPYLPSHDKIDLADRAAVFGLLFQSYELRPELHSNVEEMGSHRANWMDMEYGTSVLASEFGEQRDGTMEIMCHGA